MSAISVRNEIRSQMQHSGCSNPLITEGGVRVGQEQFLNDPFRLPGETNWPLADGSIATLGAEAGLGVIYDPGATHTGPTLGPRPGFDPRTGSFHSPYWVPDVTLTSTNSKVSSNVNDGFSVTSGWLAADEVRTLATRTTGTARAAMHQ